MAATRLESTRIAPYAVDVKTPGLQRFPSGAPSQMAQSMLPFLDTPPSPARLRQPPKRSLGDLRRPAKAFASRLEAAVADPSRVVFLDVETTGLSWFYDELTIVGWACDGTYNVHVAGDNSARLIDALRRAATLVTFNGTLFDLRFLKKTFGDLTLPSIHIDLRYLAKRAGLTGGQKAIETALGIPVRQGLDGIDGAEAVLLWHRYVRGDGDALRLLIDYNSRDVLGMCGILDQTMDRLNFQPDLLFSRPKFFDRAPAILESSAIHASSKRRPKGSRRVHTFEAMFSGTPASNTVVVGIDLTGSEARPSGWCVLRGAEAETCTVSSDDEMFSRIIAERPTLVSIDSPLSIPLGRVRVEDDDPGRAQFGIMRRSERELKRRGINVYPCLLPSMQGLTRRGMRLAQRVRAAGVPVIESYPGAAQDIMGIPRKGAGIEFLRQGLQDFGIRGSYQSNVASHDELDAITSAIVGSFFLSGQYEALSGPSEDALIIPDLKCNRRSGMVVGISGRICAGKTTIARMLERRGFAYTRFSLVIDDEIIARGEAPDRATRQRIGIEINRTKGQRWLCEKVLERVVDQQLIVIDGLRFPEDHAFFAERFGSNFVHLHVKAPDALRALRYGQSEQDDLSFQTVDRQPVEAKIDELSHLAGVVIENASSIADLEAHALDCINSLPRGQDSQCQFRLL
jgi:predicted nuclease with RNAse H fold/dephospho-CoA kinase